MHHSRTSPPRSTRSTVTSNSESLICTGNPVRSSSSTDHSRTKLRKALTARHEPTPTGVHQLPYEASASASDVIESADLDPVIMAFNWASGKLGCAYYAHEFRELWIMEDIIESPALSFAPQLIDQVAPHTVIVSNDSILMDLVRKDASGIQLDKLPSKEFTYSQGRYNLISWFAHTRELPDLRSYRSSIVADQHANSTTSANRSNILCSDPYDGLKRQAWLELSCLIDLESYVSVGCAGALLVYLAKIDDYTIRPLGSNVETSTALNPMHLRYFSSTICMQVSTVTQRAIGIFETDFHPNVHQKRGKESLSLFGLLNHTVTPIGQHLLRSWLQRPTLDLETIRFRQQAIGGFSSNDSQQLSKELRNHLKHVRNVARLVSAVSEHRATPGDWQQLLQFVYHGSKIHGIFSSHVDPTFFIARKVLSTMDGRLLHQAGNAINETIDFAQSKTEGRVIVKENVDEELDKLREMYTGLDSLLLEVYGKISPELPSTLRASSNVVYFPQLGYFIAVSREREGMFDFNMGLPPRFQLQFKTEENAYFKNDRTKELDESLGDIHGMIVDREIELLQGLTERLSEHFSDLLKMADTCAELDCLLALAHAARLHDYVQPEIALDSRIEIVQGRHPLQELSVDVFIPNDTYLVGGLGVDPSEQNESSRTSVGGFRQPSAGADEETGPKENAICASVALLTGANFSGKSVYIRQAALIVYMAHIGSFVPADKAIIGLTDKIFTCVQAVETVSKPMSAFALDIQQLSQAVHHATERSLVVIDEFGSGTDMLDGAGLLCATIDYFLAKEAKCPKVLAITHFHDLLAQKLISPNDPRINLLTMEVLSQAHTVEQGPEKRSSNSSTSGNRSSRRGNDARVDEVVFLYRVVPGAQATNSYGAWCASIAGVPPAIVHRALQLSHLIDNSLPVEPQYSNAEQAMLDTTESIVQKFLETPIAADNIKSLRELVQCVSEMI